MSEAEGLSEVILDLKDDVPFRVNSDGWGDVWIETASGRRIGDLDRRIDADELNEVFNAARAESRSTPDREGVARIIANLRARANAAHGKAPPSATALVCGEAADLIERLARPASSAGGGEKPDLFIQGWMTDRANAGWRTDPETGAVVPPVSAGGVEEALERALKEAEERAANYAENVARLYKALHNASTWIGEIISNAKAEAATIGVIPTDERAGWERTEALRRSIRYALRRAALTSKGADRG